MKKPKQKIKLISKYVNIKINQKILKELIQNLKKI